MGQAQKRGPGSPTAVLVQGDHSEMPAFSPKYFVTINICFYVICALTPISAGNRRRYQQLGRFRVSNPIEYWLSFARISILLFFVVVHFPLRISANHILLCYFVAHFPSKGEC